MLLLNSDLRLECGSVELGVPIEEGVDYTVSAVHNPLLGRDEAIKLYHEVDGDDASGHHEDARRFARLREGATPRVLSVGALHVDDSSQDAVVFERLEGRPLCDVIEEEGLMPAQRVGQLALPLLVALEEIHDNDVAVGPVAHGELILQAGRGERLRIQRHAFGELGATLPPARVGPSLSSCPSCVAPEHVMGGAYSVRGDVFWMGAWMYRALGGQAAFGTTAPELMRAYRRRVEVEPLPIWARVAPALEAVVLRALRLDPGERFGSMDEMRRALLAALGAEVEVGVDKAPRVAAPAPRVEVPMRPLVWAFVDGPEFRRPHVAEALDRLEREVELVRLNTEGRSAWLESLDEGARPAPHAVLFGDIHILLDEPILDVLSPLVEVSRVLVSAQTNLELIHYSIANFGLDSHVLADMEVDDIVLNVQDAILRAVQVRERFPGAGVVAPREGVGPGGPDLPEPPGEARPLQLQVHG